MAKKPRNERTQATVATDAVTAQHLADFAEDLGRLLGTAERKATEWLGQRQTIAERLTQVRDKANQLLQDLQAGATTLAAAVRTRRGRPVGSKSKRNPAKVKTSVRKRTGRTFTAAQRKAQGLRMKAYWAKRKSGEKK